MAMVRGKKNPAHVGLPSRLKSTRRHCGLKRRPLAEKAGVAPSTLSDIEAGEQVPTVGTVARIASALGVSAAYLGFAIGDKHTGESVTTTDGMGTRLATVRMERKLTKAALARLVSLSPSAFAKIENGGQTGVDTIEALAKALGVSPAWIAFNMGPQLLPKRRRAAVDSARVPVTGPTPRADRPDPT